MEIIQELPGLPWLKRLALISLALNAWVIAPSLRAPTRRSPQIYVILHRLSTVLAGNYGRARNAAPPKP